MSEMKRGDLYEGNHARATGGEHIYCVENKEGVVCGVAPLRRASSEDTTPTRGLAQAAGTTGSRGRSGRSAGFRAVLSLRQGADGTPTPPAPRGSDRPPPTTTTFKTKRQRVVWRKPPTADIRSTLQPAYWGFKHEGGHIEGLFLEGRGPVRILEVVLKLRRYKHNTTTTTTSTTAGLCTKGVLRTNGNRLQ